MVGGTVIGIARPVGPEAEEGTLLHVRDTTYKNDTCCVRVVERRKDNGESIEIGIGDSVWWQCGEVMWTPLSVRPHNPGQGCGSKWDIRLPKVGYSHGAGILVE